MGINHDPGAVRVQVKHHGVILVEPESIELVQASGSCYLVARVLFDDAVVYEFLEAEFVAGAFEKLPRHMNHHLIIIIRIQPLPLLKHRKAISPLRQILQRTHRISLIWTNQSRRQRADILHFYSLAWVFVAVESKAEAGDLGKAAV